MGMGQMKFRIRKEPGRFELLVSLPVTSAQMGLVLLWLLGVR
jgi:hypothetical protein